MDIQVDFFRWQVPDLKEYLQHRGTACYLYRKHELVKLCELAQELDLEKITSTNDFELSQVNRRTITENGVTHFVCEIGQVPIWSSVLKRLPNIEQCDILFIKKCDRNDDMIASNCTKKTTEMPYKLLTLPSIRYTLRNTAPVLIKLNGPFHFYRE
jgi:hypothetical protein